MIHRLALRHAAGTTPIVIGPGALAAAHADLSAWLAGRTVFVVSSPRVLSLHGAVLGPVLGAAARVETFEVPEGETAKSVEVLAELWRRMLAAGGKRDSRVVALGGGSVSDLAGFAAATFLRGIEFAAVPTTLLAQVDAAIGGKTGIDLPGAKNSVGAFRMPAAVVADTVLLGTLPRAELRAGLAEAIKVAFVLDPGLFALLEDQLEILLEGDPMALAPVVAAAAGAKVAVVERDPFEAGERRVLNFGHTLGHALETVALDRGGDLAHGDAVAWGMLFALRLAERRGLPGADADRLRALVARLGPPPLAAYDPDELLAVLARDKKALESGIRWVFPTCLGAWRTFEDVAAAEVREELATFLPRVK